MYEYTIPSKTEIKRFIKNREYYCIIDLPNGAKCNPNFFWECVRLGILSEDD